MLMRNNYSSVCRHHHLLSPCVVVVVEVAGCLFSHCCTYSQSELTIYIPLGNTRRKKLRDITTKQAINFNGENISQICFYAHRPQQDARLDSASWWMGVYCGHWLSCLDDFFSESIFMCANINCQAQKTETLWRKSAYWFIQSTMLDPSLNELYREEGWGKRCWR